MNADIGRTNSAIYYIIFFCCTQVCATICAILFFRFLLTICHSVVIDVRRLTDGFSEIYLYGL